MLRVIKEDGSPTRFFVESNCLQCGNHQCVKLFNKYLKQGLHSGMKCPKCGGMLDHRWHLVDIAEFNGNGFCGCEFFAFRQQPLLTRATPAEQGMGKWRCKHIVAARDFALDVALRAHRYDNKRKAA